MFGMISVQADRNRPAPSRQRCCRVHTERHAGLGVCKHGVPELSFLHRVQKQDVLVSIQV